jgi:hypothetical protein
MADYKKMTDEELLVEVNRLWAICMSYHAAEGNWSQERFQREEANKEYYECLTEIDNRGLRLG